ncbi:MAG: BtpA/SgcQ family protein [Verrucomicrobiae bacterium]|nr:BtpA/SgcQ family protein [Verrucomicrobiae bacterium]
MRILTEKPRSLIGMVHIGALPGTPHAVHSVAVLAAKAREEALVLQGAGYDAIMIENMHDRPYLRSRVGPEIVAAMAVVAGTVASSVEIPCGIQILAAANCEALAVAHAAGLRFIRAEAFTFAHVADEGTINASAGELLRFRKAIGAESVLIMADIQKKHASHALTSDICIADHARAVEYCCGDAVVVTGAHTGEAAKFSDLSNVRAATALPVVVGSGTTPDLVQSYSQADAVIVGSWIKVDGNWRNAVCPVRARQLRDAFHSL